MRKALESGGTSFNLGILYYGQRENELGHVAEKVPVRTLKLASPARLVQTPGLAREGEIGRDCGSGKPAVGPALRLFLLQTGREVNSVTRACPGLAPSVLFVYQTQIVARDLPACSQNSSCEPSGLVRQLPSCNESVITNPLPFSLSYKVEPQIKLPLKMKAGNLRTWHLPFDLSIPGAQPTLSKGH